VPHPLSKIYDLAVGAPALNDTPGQSQQVAWKVKHWAALVGLGVSSTFDLIATDEIKALRLGKQLTLIVTPPWEWIARKVAQQEANGGQALPKIRRVRDLPAADRSKHLGAIQVKLAASDGIVTAEAPARPKRGRPPGGTDRQPRKPRSPAASIA
jgi:hypothetical protein